MNLVTKLAQEIMEQPVGIAVIGDMMIDHWVYGHVLPCQDHCPKFMEVSKTETFGGALNAGNCLKHWNVNTVTTGQSQRDYCHKWRFINEEGTIIFRHDDDRLNKDDYENRRRSALDTINNADGVLISDYDKGFLTEEFIRDIINTCKWCNIPCVVDAKRAPELYIGAILKGNAEWCRKYETSDVITCGDKQPFVNGVQLKNKLPQVKCVNHVGAGDCFASHLTLALACDFSLEDAATIAHSAGRVYVQHPHNRPPCLSEIAEDLEKSMIN